MKRVLLSLLGTGVVIVATAARLPAADPPLEPALRNSETRDSETLEPITTMPPRVEKVIARFDDASEAVLLTSDRVFVDSSVPSEPRKKTVTFPILRVDAAATVQTVGGEKIEWRNLVDLLKTPRRVLIVSDLDPYYLDMYKPDTIVIAPAKLNYGTPDAVEPRVVPPPPGFQGTSFTAPADMPPTPYALPKLVVPPGLPPAPVPVIVEPQ